MTDHTQTAEHSTPDQPLRDARLGRRRFLTLGGAGLVAGAAAMAGTRALLPAPGDPSPAIASRAAAITAPNERILVMVQLPGGLDFLDTIIPTGGRYHDLRGPGAVGEAGRQSLDEDFSFHPSLSNTARLWQQGQLAIVHGIGLPNNSLSHFVDTDIWHRGRTEVGDGSGWLGRALGALPEPSDPLLGVSIAGLTPAMASPDWSAVALPDDGILPWSADFINEHPGVVAAYQDLLASTPGSGGTLADRARASQRLVREVADTVRAATDLERVAMAAEALAEDEGASEEEDVEEMDERGTGVLHRRLSLVADLINGGLPTRAYHVGFGDFDTHANQQQTLPTLLTELDTAIASFRSALGSNAERVVLATWTEFGRRPDWNGNGTDHGTAGTHFVIGTDVIGGHHGDPVDLHRFDRDDNFLVTGHFSDYLGGLTQGGLGVEAGRVMSTSTAPIELVQA